MNQYLKERLKPVLKFMKLDIPYYYFRAVFFIKKVAVAVEKDLSTLLPIGEDRAGSGLELKDITSAALMQATLVYPAEGGSEDRYGKAMRYLKRGYRGFALTRESTVCGDIWYVDANSGPKEAFHPDLKWLAIHCGAGETYAFDMHVYPQQRGHNMAVLLQNGALHELRKQGYRKVYGYYWADYIPALWVHRTLRFKELKRITVTKLPFIHRYESREIQSPGPR